ncbi:hypothetical protein GGQ88_002810 [Novosphingobium hassiacum]|uniref:Secreted protein n=1 Tax=Novosphingobium hassiacum TaxID=173676 RepID=A0A7W6EWS4_9SPHN|nr:hypothetical protein [Novosphingobium hassiacum]MBB3861526.1 hypothetical protein [Novosphingobium hassiacum]
MIRNSAITLAALLAAGLCAPALAAPTPSTRLVHCDAGNCLVVTGRRADAAAPVSINGHAVQVRGTRKWRAVVPVQTVREWSEPYARTVTVSVAASDTEADLPIGLLGHAEKLAMLVVRVK